jgi:hypothetical protein
MRQCEKKRRRKYATYELPTPLPHTAHHTKLYVPHYIACYIAPAPAAASGP